MRIDFTRLQQQQVSNQPNQTANPPFSNSISDLWNKSQRKFQNSIAEESLQQSALTFSVSYPYEISRTVSPSAIKKQLAYIEAKRQLPTNTIRFIQKQLDCELNKKSEVGQIVSNVGQQQEKADKKSIYFNKQLNKNKEAFNLTNKIKPCQPFRSNFQSSIHTKKKVKPRPEVKSKVYETKEKELREQKYRRQQKELDGVTLRPILNYTMNSKVTKIVNKKRNKYFKTCNINVFQSLYNDASLYATKRQIEKTIMQEESISISRKSSRVKVYSTFQERLQSSIEKQADRKKKAQNKLQFDLSTGKKYFIPDTNQSKVTYHSLFKARKNDILSIQVESYPARAAHYSKDSQKIDHSQQITTTLNNSYEKQLNKSLDSKYKILRKPLPRENKLAQIYAELLWSQSGLRDDGLNQQQKNVLNPFLEQILSYSHLYSKNITKQVFIAFFKIFYANMNLFDRAILDARLKAAKDIQKREELALTQTKNTNKIQPRQGDVPGRKKSYSHLNHTSKHFYI